MELAGGQPSRVADLLFLVLGGEAGGELGKDGSLGSGVVEDLQLPGEEVIGVGAKRVGFEAFREGEGFGGVFGALVDRLFREDAKGGEAVFGILFGKRNEDLTTDFGVGFQNELGRGEQDFLALGGWKILQRSAGKVHSGLGIPLSGSESHLDDGASCGGMGLEFFQGLFGDGGLAKNEGLLGKDD